MSRLIARPQLITPPDAFSINWGHPLARGLVEVIVSPNLGKASAINNTIAGGTLASSATAVGASGRGVSFPNGTSDKLTYTGAWTNPTPGFTLLADYVITSGPSGFPRIAGNLANGPQGFALIPNGSNFRAITISGAPGNVVLTGSAMAIGKRKADVLIVAASGSDTFWENGVQTASASRTGYSAPSSTPFTIGADNAVGTTAPAIVFATFLWNRELSPAEVAQISANPYQILMPAPGIARYLNTVGATTHATSGALTGQIGSVVGSAARFRAFSTSGALTGQIGSVVGAAARNSSAVTHATSGALTGQIGGVAGASARFRAFSTSGAITGPGALIVGTASHNIPHPVTGVLTGQGATITGTAQHNIPHASSGDLVGPGAAMFGVALRAAPGQTFGFLRGLGLYLRA